MPFTCESFARKHGLQILLPFTPTGWFDVEGALLASSRMLVHVAYGRGEGSVTFAPTLHPQFWIRAFEARELAGLAALRGTSPEGELRFPPLSVAIAEALGDADPVVPFVSEWFDPGNVFDFIKRYYERQRAETSPLPEPPRRLD